MAAEEKLFAVVLKLQERYCLGDWPVQSEERVDCQKPSADGEWKGSGWACFLAVK